MKPSEKQTAHRHNKTNTVRDSLLRLRAEDEPTTSSSSSVTSRSNRSVESVRGVPGRSPGLWVVASRHERRGFVSDSERFPRTAQRPGVATPQRSKPLAPPSWGGANTYKTAYINTAGVRGRTPAGTCAGTPTFRNFKVRDSRFRLFSCSNCSATADQTQDGVGNSRFQSVFPKMVFSVFPNFLCHPQQSHSGAMSCGTFARAGRWHTSRTLHRIDGHVGNLRGSCSTLR